MEYIECTHCGKRYAANEKIKNAAGEFVRCKNCLEKFMIVVRDSKERDKDAKEPNLNATSGWDPTLTAPPHEAVTPEATTQESSKEENEEQESQEIDWDPSLTMPEAEANNEEESEALSEEESQAKAEEALAAIQQDKKKKMMMLGLLGAVLILLALTLYMALSGEEEVVQQQTHVAKHVSPQELDKQSSECRIAAARQWLLDYKAMHDSYDAKTFINMLKQSESREEALLASCKTPDLSNIILDAATAGEKPEWFATEIQAIARK